jgi:stress response protein YsnF
MQETLGKGGHIVDRKERSDRFTELEERYAGYEVYDPQGEKIGKVDDLFINENDQPEYIGVKMGFLGMKATLIPMDVCTVDEGRRVIEVSESKDRVKDAPSFDDDEEITPEYENTVRSYFGLEGLQTSADRGSYGPYYPSVRAEEDYTGEERTDTGESERAEQRERPGAATAGYREEESRADALGEEYSSGAGEAQTGAGTEDREREESQDYPGISIGGREGREPQEQPMQAATGPGAESAETGGVQAQPTAGEPQAGEEAAESRAGTETAGESRADAGTAGTGAAARFQTGTGTDAGGYESGGVRVHKRVQPGVGEHESESMRVQKRVRTDREQIRVPKEHEEVRVERVPTEEGGEELRVRKETVEDEEVVEVDVDKEEVEVDDESGQDTR